MSDEESKTAPGAREGEGPETVSPDEGHPTTGAGRPGADKPEEGAGASSAKNTPEISTEDQGGDQTGPTPGETQGSPPKDE